MIFKPGQIVERKNSLLAEEQAHNVPPGTIGICTGEEKVSPSGRTRVEVLFAEPVGMHELKRQKWWVLPELLIPRDDLMEDA